MSELQAHIRNLSINDRIALIAFIAESIQEDQADETKIHIPDHIAEKWALEANEKVDKMKSGEIETTSWPQLKDRLFNKYGL